MSESVTCPNPECNRLIPGDSAGDRCPSCGHSLTTASGVATIAVPSTATENLTERARLGRFEVRRLLGEGAFGKVYEASDPTLDRKVALKVAKLDASDSAQRVKRFLREAKAAANLRHPHIVPIFEFGQEENQFFIASAFIVGKTLKDALAEEKKDLTIPNVQRVVNIVRRLAEALAYAHSQGIVHRDVKPANIMLDDKGEPLLMDFGLATRKDGAEEITHAGQILGTPLYMSPEQARGEQGAAVPASDQYSLGVLLYEMLTGQPPFTGTPALVMHHHLETVPRPPRQVLGTIPRDLQTICLRCLEKDPIRRYPDCQVLADDLRRWSEGELIHARHIGTLERAGRWCRKNPLSAALIGAVAVSLILGTVVAWILAREAQASAEAAHEATNKAVASAKKAQENEAIAEGRLYASYISLAQQAWESNKAHLAQHYLALCRPDLRGWEHDYLATLFASNQRTLRGHKDAVTSVAYNRDGTRLVSASGDGIVKIWDPVTGKAIHSFQAHSPRTSSMAIRVVFHPDGKKFATWESNPGGIPEFGHKADKPGIKFWDTIDARLLGTAQPFRENVRVFAYDQEGDRYAASGWDESAVSLFDAKTNRRIWKVPSLIVTHLAFSPDGKTLAGGLDAGFIQTWDSKDGMALQTMKEPGTAFAIMAFSSKGDRLLVGNAFGRLALWDVATAKSTHSVDAHFFSVKGVAFSPDDSTVISVGRDRSVQIRASEDLRLVRTLKGHLDAIHAVTVHPREPLIATGSDDRTVKIWAANKSQEAMHVTCARGKLVFVGDNGIVAANGSLDYWDLPTSRPLRSVRAIDAGLVALAISPDGKTLVTGGGDLLIKLWDASTGELRHTFKGHDSEVSSVAFGPDNLIVSGDKMGTLTTWDVNTAQAKKTHRLGENRMVIDEISEIVFTLGGRRFVTSSRAALVLWDAMTEEKLRILREYTNVESNVAVSHDGRLVAAGMSSGNDNDGNEKVVKVWDTATGKSLWTLTGHADHVNAVAFHPDNKTLVSGSNDRMVKMWDVETGRLIRTLKGHTEKVESVAISPDGKRIASGGWDGMLRIWDTASRQETLAIQASKFLVGRIYFSPDGKRIITTRNNESTATVWDASNPLQPDHP